MRDLRSVLQGYGLFTSPDMRSKDAGANIIAFLGLQPVHMTHLTTYTHYQINLLIIIFFNLNCASVSVCSSCKITYLESDLTSEV